LKAEKALWLSRIEFERQNGEWLMNVLEFVTESNRIEGILRPPTDEEVDATRDFVLGAHVPNVESLCALALTYAPGVGLLRDRDTMNVRVGSHVAPRGGPHIRANLAGLLKTIGESDPFDFHVVYETLHPFMDGNGRTGRALWAWQMWRSKPEYLDLGFLHAWYYLTLQAARPKAQDSNALASSGTTDQG
jgi:hypothetical protein